MARCPRDSLSAVLYSRANLNKSYVFVYVEPMNEFITVLISGLLIPAILWFFRPSQTRRLDLISKLAKVEQDVSGCSVELRTIVQAEIRAEIGRRNDKNRWVVFGAFVVLGILLAYAILRAQLWYIESYYKAGDLGASIAGNPDVAIGLAFSALAIFFVIGARVGLSRGPKP